MATGTLAFPTSLAVALLQLVAVMATGTNPSVRNATMATLSTVMAARRAASVRVVMRRVMVHAFPPMVPFPAFPSSQPSSKPTGYVNSTVGVTSLPTYANSTVGVTSLPPYTTPSLPTVTCIGIEIIIDVTVIETCSTIAPGTTGEYP